MVKYIVIIRMGDWPDTFGVKSKNVPILTNNTIAKPLTFLFQEQVAAVPPRLHKLFQVQRETRFNLYPSKHNPFATNCSLLH